LTLISASEITSVGIVIGGLAFLNFLLFMRRGSISLTVDDINTVHYFKATALSYSTIVFCQFINILERRDERTSLFNKNFFSNKILLISIAISVGLVALVIYGPYISHFLAFAPITPTDWLFILGAAAIYLVIFEGLKLYKRMIVAKKPTTKTTNDSKPSPI
jgi:Ca2+-transporting ATPase